jgi:hypothetical protein
MTMSEPPLIFATDGDDRLIVVVRSPASDG